ncbi:MAG: hypothetical protein HKN88_05660 [Gammaproteobacteria bacterium]|nr:hypothetical protein [Gammaproteobacteria bacterium]NNC97541.1 hypothetical protein [Gammaproteobacteria bacterium]
MQAFKGQLEFTLIVAIFIPVSDLEGDQNTNDYNQEVEENCEPVLVANVLGNAS